MRNKDVCGGEYAARAVDCNAAICALDALFCLSLRRTGERVCSPLRKQQISLTAEGISGLMRPVARIAQSVEQGIENPRVLGSIPSPGTTHL